MISLEEARAQSKCRVCEKSIFSDGPAGWKDDFYEMTWPCRVTLKHGEEFAHTECLEKTDEDDQGEVPGQDLRQALPDQS